MPLSLTVKMIPKEARNVIQKLEDAGYEAWCVGGCVRDALLGRTPKDWDVTTSALPEQVMELFGRRAIPRGLKHGTVWVRSGGDGVDVTTFRCDGEYEDHRRPASVTFTDSLDEDLWRRDLTVNAMAYNMRGELRDPFGGQADLERRILRCVGEPDRRFQEDALRMMRVLRFSAVLGFEIEPEVEAAVHRNRELLGEIAIERISLEMQALLAGEDAAEILRRFPDVIAVFWPEILEMVGFEQRNVHHCYDVWEHTLHALDAAERLDIPRPVRRDSGTVPAGRRGGGTVPAKQRGGGTLPAVRGQGKGGAPRKEPPWDLTEERTVLCFAALLHDIGKPRRFTLDEQGGGHFLGHWETGRDMADEMLARLRCSRLFRERVTRLVGMHEVPIPKTEKSVRRLLGRLGEEDLRLLLLLKRADNLAQSPAYQDRQRELDSAERMMETLLRRGACFTLRQMAVNGRDMVSMGLKGPDIGAVLGLLLDRVLNGELPNERKPLLKAAAKLARTRRETGSVPPPDPEDPEDTQSPEPEAVQPSEPEAAQTPKKKKKKRKKRKRKKKPPKAEEPSETEKLSITEKPSETGEPSEA